MPPKNQRWWLTEDQVELVIEADAELLYDMVSDLPRIGEWSPECERVDWEGEVTVPAEGTTFIGHNAVGPAGAFVTRVTVGCSRQTAAKSSPSSPMRVGVSRPCGATGSSRRRAGPG